MNTKSTAGKTFTSYDTIVFQTSNSVVSLDLEKHQVISIHPADAGILRKALQSSAFTPQEFESLC